MGDGYKTALINFRFFANTAPVADEAVKKMME
jgi:hypothetical protein